MVLKNKVKYAQWLEKRSNYYTHFIIESEYEGIIKWYGRENTIKNFILVCFVIGKNIYIYFLYIYILYVPVGTLGYRLCQGQSSSGVTYQFKKM